MYQEHNQRVLGRKKRPKTFPQMFAVEKLLLYSIRLPAYGKSCHTEEDFNPVEHQHFNRFPRVEESPGYIREHKTESKGARFTDGIRAKLVCRKPAYQ